MIEKESRKRNRERKHRNREKEAEGEVVRKRYRLGKRRIVKQANR